jgi:predicted restriction endonuclease
MRRKQPIPTKLRLQVIDRDNGRCRACGIGDRDALQADHITPESKGGKTRLDNLQALCGVCNNRKQNTVVELAIRPSVDGFGDYNQVMQDRTAFLETLSDIRQGEIVRLTAIVAAWRQANVKGCIIRNRLEKMVDKRKVEGILKATR